jgi:MFS family permease
MLMVAVGWQMYELTGQAWDLGLVGLYQFAPALLFALPAGYIADRFSRVRIVTGCLLLQCLVAALLCMASAQSSGLGPHGDLMTREWLLAVSVLLGVARAFQMPAQQALIAKLVPSELLPQAMAFSASGLQAAIIAGPALGGALFVAGASTVYASCAALFVVGALCSATIRYRQVSASDNTLTLESLFAGVSFIAQRKLILGAVSLDLFAVLLGGAAALLPIFARDILHVGAWGLGLLRGAPAVGALLVSIALTRWPLDRHVGAKLLVAVAAFGLATLVFGVSTNFWVSLIALAISGGADMVNVVIRQTLVQLETPDAMRGRVSAVNSVFIGASNQLGEFESGATAAWLGPVGSVVLGGVGTIVIAAVWWKIFPALGQRDAMTPK